MSEEEADNANNAPSKELNQTEKGRKRKYTLTADDRAREEVEAIIKGLGPEIEGRRYTRSVSMGIPATLPPPVKRERKSSPITNKIGRGRPKKNVNEVQSQGENKDYASANVEEPAKLDDTTDKTEGVSVENTNAKKNEDEEDNLDAAFLTFSEETNAPKDATRDNSRVTEEPTASGTESEKPE